MIPFEELSYWTLTEQWDVRKTGGTNPVRIKEDDGLNDAQKSTLMAEVEKLPPLQRPSVDLHDEQVISPLQSMYGCSV